MQFAGKKPPPAIIVLFVTFFPLQGFFNLVVYKFPQINRYFEQKRKGSVSGSISGGSISSFLSSLRRSNMEKKRKKGKGRVSARLTSFTVESENRTSTIVKESEVPGDQNVEETDVGKSTVAFAPDAELKGHDQSLEENPDRIEDGWEDDNGIANNRDETDAIDELAHIVEA